MEYKVSVVVPVYNGAQYVESCCEQLVHQTMSKLEIIFVDDGSIDDSMEIIERCAARYENVIAVHQENRGVSAARNHGIALASGEYVGFVDVDDLVDSDMYEVLLQIADEDRVDIVCMEGLGSLGEKTILRSQNQWMSAFFQATIRISAWNKLFKKSLFQEKSFPEGKRIHEDMCAVYKALTCAQSVALVNIEKYHYIHREGSSSRVNVFSEKYFDAIDIADWIYADAIKRFPDIPDLVEARKAKTYLRISKIYYLRGAPKEYSERILQMRGYLKSLPKGKLSTYFTRNDIIRYYLYIYLRPLFFLLIKTIDKG